MMDASRSTPAFREAVLSRLGAPWDLLVIGGGITGAGILREAARFGLSALLVEQRDFGWGTSSRSSKLVHGGLRYLKQGKLRLTSESVHERERLVLEGPGLVERLGFLLASYPGDHPGRVLYGAGLVIYDLLAGRWNHQHLSAEELRIRAPRIASAGLRGGFWFGDAETDDARLVFRVVREAVRGGASALNYARVEELLIQRGDVAGVVLADVLGGRVFEVHARAVVNATGAWADRLRAKTGAAARLRPLRGSHLVFPAWRLPAPQAMSILHPRDHRPLFVVPWEGVTIFGTTDVDHRGSLDEEPAIGSQETSYLMEALKTRFPSLDLGLNDVLATFAGVRPIIGTGTKDPSKESRDHAIWEERGLVTVTGGKLTTFRLIALHALRAVRRRLAGPVHLDESTPILDPVPRDLPAAHGLSEGQRRRLLGRYGVEASGLVAAAREGELTPFPSTPVLPAEIRWAARSEWPAHLDDLLLRRVRLGLVARQGGAAHLPVIREICREELGWDEARWASEEAAYRELWKKQHGVPVDETAKVA
ncbi:MAG: glycerol-3-phosphate dehydrogenase/oxidase [Thermoanaerobaculia bacterium]